jgi:organic radical activating enzyme
MRQKNILCAVPFVKAWVDQHGKFRNCCVADPEITSETDQNFDAWWSSNKLVEFKQSLTDSVLPPACHRCVLKESVQQESFRTAVNKSIDFANTDFSYPSRWDIQFGNKCNLACWTCNENSSSLITAHKKKIGILPTNFKNADTEFFKNWEHTRSNILKSYKIHSIVTLTIVGGEPMFSKKFLNFLQELLDLNLATRTKLEIHTNGTFYNSRIEKLLSKQLWNYICVFVSADAIGTKANWLRYGSNWDTVDQNIKNFQKLVNYVEVHCVLSVLNINDLTSLKNYCDQNLLKLQVTTLARPSFMNLSAWPLDKDLLCDVKDLTQSGFVEYYNLIGSEPNREMPQLLKHYIQSFDKIRQPLQDFDPVLAKILALDVK